MPKTINTFGGYRLVGYIDGKPLTAKFKITQNNFEVGFNQNILDREYVGKFTKQLEGKKFEYPSREYMAALGKPLQSKGGRTTESTLPWIATLIEVAKLEQGTTKNGHITRDTFRQIAMAIYSSNAFYAKDKKDLVIYRDIAKLFDLKRSTNQYLDTLQKNTFTQFRRELSIFSEIAEVTLGHQQLMGSRDKLVA